jgi:hypothetical protein
MHSCAAKLLYCKVNYITYPIRVSPVPPCDTHVIVDVISTVYTPILLLVALCVSHFKMRSNACDRNVMKVL